MAKLELTIDQARQNAANFLYVFANFNVNGKPYLSYIEKKYRTIISGKRANQQKLLLNSARMFFNNKNAQLNGAEYNQYVNAVQDGFIETYGMKPQEALIKLAQGETVAGKNWKEGIYGIGGRSNKFEGAALGSNTVTVDPDTGHIFINGTDVTDETKTVRRNIGGKVVDYQFGSKDYGTGLVFESQRFAGKYYAYRYTDTDGIMHTADGAVTTTTDGADMWGNINLTWENVLDWISSIINYFFGTNLPTSNSDTVTNRMTPENTLPNQKADGYVTESGMGDAMGLALVAVAAGTLIFGGMKKRKASNQ